MFDNSELTHYPFESEEFKGSIPIPKDTVL